MANKVSAIRQDFADVLQLFQGNEACTFTAKGTNALRNIHRATYSLIWWKFNFKFKELHRSIYLQELASDAIQILPLAMLGYSKAAFLLSRGVIENTARHIYFSDHPVEFQRSNESPEWYPQVRDLFEYLKAHPTFQKTEPKFDGVARLRRLYAEVSSAVHALRVDRMELRKGISEIAPTDSLLEDIASTSKRIAEATNFLLAAYHQPEFVNLRLDKREVILMSFPDRARRVIARLE